MRSKMKILNSFSFFTSIIILCCLWRPSELRKDRDCIQRCGNIEIPYPFGIGPDHCFLNPFFAVSCNSSSSTQSIPYLKKLNFEILEVRKSSNSIIVMIPSITACNDTEIRWNSPNLPSNDLSFGESNLFVSVGCHGYALLYSDNLEVEGCTSLCTPDHQDSNSTLSAETMDQCYGFNNCCQIDDILLGGTMNYSITVSITNRSGHCRSAFLISRESLATVATVPAMSAAPVMLNWYIYYDSVLDRPLLSKLINYVFPIFDRPLLRNYVFPTVGPFTFACYCVWQCWCCKTKNRRKETKLRKKYFKGRLEEQRLNQEEAKKTKLFTEKELKKATDNFNENRIIGKGGQGTVYKGMLTDGNLIAVKRSSSFSEGQWREFINEVIILSHVNHRNVVKLLGCCLETKTALLVYEFIPNGTLSELIHSPNEEFRVTWDIRLRIAAEVSRAIAYLHSSSSTPIYHRDIKSSNILLNHKYTAKVCDFGISRSTSMDQTHLTTCVRGTFGYLDPQYFRSRQFTEKSDVYSFGVVLVEILTGQKPILETSEGATSLVMQFIELSNDSAALHEMMDPIILESNIMTEDIMVVVNLAKRCLHHEGSGRPTMMQVAIELACLSQKVCAKLAASSKQDTSDHSQDFFSTKTHLDDPACSF